MVLCCRGWIFEKADVIIVQQVVKLAEDEVSSMKVIGDDTDVFALFIYYYAQEHLTCDLITPNDLY